CPTCGESINIQQSRPVGYQRLLAFIFTPLHCQRCYSRFLKLDTQTYRHYAIVFVWLCVATMLTFPLRGYLFGSGNHSFYLPFIYKLQRPTLFVNDPLVDANVHNTFFYPVIAVLSTVITPEFLFFNLQILFTLLYFHSVYLLARKILHRRTAAL